MHYWVCLFLLFDLQIKSPFRTFGHGMLKIKVRENDRDPIKRAKSCSCITAEII